MSEIPKHLKNPELLVRLFHGWGFNENIWDDFIEEFNNRLKLPGRAKTIDSLQVIYEAYDRGYYLRGDIEVNAPDSQNTDRIQGSFIQKNYKFSGNTKSGKPGFETDKYHALSSDFVKIQSDIANRNISGLRHHGLKNEISVVITHSFGLHFYAQMQLPKPDILLILSGFSDFCAIERDKKNFIGHRMVHFFKENPQNVLSKFFNNVYHPDSLPKSVSFIKNPDGVENLNVSLLASDLEELFRSRVESEFVKKHHKVLIVHGENDKIVSVGHAELLAGECFESKTLLIPSGGHAILHKNAPEIADFLISSLESEYI